MLPRSPLRTSTSPRETVLLLGGMLAAIALIVVSLAAIGRHGFDVHGWPTSASVSAKDTVIPDPRPVVLSSPSVNRRTGAVRDGVVRPARGDRGVVLVAGRGGVLAPAATAGPAAGSRSLGSAPGGGSAAGGSAAGGSGSAGSSGGAG